MKDYAPAEIRLARFLRFTALVNGLLYLFGLVGAYQGASSPTWIEPPFVSNAVASLSLLALLAWFASGDVRRWRTMIHLLVVGFAVDVVGLIIMLPGPKAAGMTTMLVTAMGFSLFFGGMILWLVQGSTCTRRPLDALDAGQAPDRLGKVWADSIYRRGCGFAGGDGGTLCVVLFRPGSTR